MCRISSKKLHINLAGRKNELPSAEKMNVEVKNRLSAVRIRIDDHAITVIGKTLFAGNLSGG